MANNSNTAWVRTLRVPSSCSWPFVTLFILLLWPNTSWNIQQWLKCVGRCACCLMTCRLLDMRIQIYWIMRSMRRSKQVLMFSSTLARDTRVICKKLTNDVITDVFLLTPTTELWLVLVLYLLYRLLVLFAIYNWWIIALVAVLLLGSNSAGQARSQGGFEG